MAAAQTNIERTGSAGDDLQGRLSLPLPLPLPLRIVLCVVAGAVLAGWVTLAALHVDDDYRVTHVQGVWIAAAEAARAGQLYPPLFDGERYAGTRYMPLAIGSNAVAAALVGDPLMGGKLLAAALMITLLGLVVLVLRRLACPWPLAVALASGVVATGTGLQAGTTIGGDLLPVVLQVGALSVALRGRDRRAMVIAGAFAGLALASKLTGLWALLGIATWLAAGRRWRLAVTFAAAGAVTAAIVLGVVQLLSAGGLSQHILAFWVAGVHGKFATLLRAPNQVLYNLLASASGAVVLFPLAVVGAWLSRSWRHLSLIHVAFGYALVLLLIVYADVGTGPNQLLDVVVLTALAAGHLAGRAAAGSDQPGGHVIALAVAITVAWATGLDLVRTVGFDARRAVAALKAGAAMPRAANVVASMIRPDEEVLAEDPSIYVALGRRPLLMDAFMLTRLDRLHPEWVDPIIAKIAERRFGLVVLVVSLDDRSVDFWWTDYHFGPRIANALRASYKLERSVGRYYLYRPQPTAAAGHLPGAIAHPDRQPDGKAVSESAGEAVPAS